MKTKLALIKSLGGYLRLGAAAGTVLLSCGLPLHARAAAFDSPVGTTWDVVMGGRHQGLAVMVFNADGTFSVDSILVPKPPPQPPASSSDDDRGTGGDVSRTGTSAGNTNSVPALPAHTNIFGHTTIPRNLGSAGIEVEPGQWGFDAKGRLVGYYTDVSGYSICVTNEVLVNTGIGIVTNFVVDCNRLTNAISFVGSVVPGKHLTLNATTPDGKSTFTGVPVSTNLPDLSGGWTGLKTENPLTFNEFFTNAPNPELNTYTVSGMGPGYMYAGTAFFSKSGKFAIAAVNNPTAGFSDNSTDVTVRSVMGSLNKQKFTFSTTGLEQPSGQDEPRIKFTGARVSVP